MDCSFGDVNMACDKLVQEACERRGLLCPATMPGFKEWAQLAELAEALNPWSVGLGLRTPQSIERDVKTLNNAAAVCEHLLGLWEVRIKEATTKTAQ